MENILKLTLRRSYCCVAFLTVQLLFMFGVVLQPDVVLAAEVLHPLETADTSSPKATLKSFLTGMHSIYMRRSDVGRITQESAGSMEIRNQIFRCFDFSELTPAVKTSLAKEAAVCLKEVIDRIELPPESAWPDTDAVAEKEITKWVIPHTDISIVKIADGPRKGEFLFSAQTVDRATEFYRTVKEYRYKERELTTPGFYEWFISEPGWMIPGSWLPAWSRARWYGQDIWQWMGFVLTLLLAFVLMVTIYLIGRGRSKQMRSNLARYFITLIFPVVALFIPLVAKYFIVEQLQVYGNLMVTTSFVLQLIFLLALMILIMGMSSRLADLIIATPWIKPAGLDAQLVRLSCRLLSIVGVTVVVFEGGSQLGISLTTLLAGVSVSGLALALAAQDSLKNILGSMMIMLDKPFKVGERIVVKGFDGVVEDIGLRSTRIRLLTGHQVTIPNEEMARVEIENIGRRPYIRRSATIELPSDTPAVKINRALEILRTILEDHEGMQPEFPPRIFLRDVNPGSLGILIMYWYHPPNYWDFLAFSERVTIAMSEQFEAEGIVFAAPALTVHGSSTETPQKQ